MWTEESVHTKPQPTHTLQSKSGHFAWLAACPPCFSLQSRVCALLLCSYFQEVPVHRNHGSSHSMRQLVWGGLTVPPSASIPFTTYYTKPTYHTKQGHGEGGSGTERQRSWERVWSRSLMMSNPRSWGCLAWRKETEGRPYFSLQLPKRSLKQDGGKFLTSSNKEQDEVA